VARPMKLDTFANNSFGFGGHNAIVIGRRITG
jgi:3-oxoacyl-(acyl-carrier-protein) synthase